MNLYTDNDPDVCRWAQNLVNDRKVPPGRVLQADIRDLTSADLAGYRQCHFFCGILGWPHALDLAGWPRSRPVWTASCPCQPLSSAGQRQGAADERHLWPALFRLVAELRPPVLLGEQVGSTLGREWLSGVRLDLEHLGYACGAADLPAASVGAPHIRQRLYFAAFRLVDADSQRRDGQALHPRRRRPPPAAADEPRSHDRLADPELDAADTGRLAAGPGSGAAPPSAGTHAQPRRRSSAGPWEDSEWIACADGKARRAQPGAFPLADGVPGRMVLLRGYGNAVVPPLAAAFISAAMAAASTASGPVAGW